MTDDENKDAAPGKPAPVEQDEFGKALDKIASRAKAVGTRIIKEQATGWLDVLDGYLSALEEGSTGSKKKRKKK